MWTASAIAALLVAAGLALKGALAHVLMIGGIWMLKKTLIVWFWTSSYGRRLWRGIRWRAYRTSSPAVRRKLFRAYGATVRGVLAAEHGMRRLRPW